jgi:hypothetical protein
MPDIYAGTSDCYMRVDNEPSWSGARDLAIAESISTTTSKNAAAWKVAVNAAQTQYDVYRSFFAINTSGITLPPTSATLKLYGYINSDVSSIISKVDASATGDSTTNFITNDFGKVSFSAYSSEITSWTVSGYNEITLNAAALADMAALDEFKFALINYTYDFLDVTPTSSTSDKAGVYYANEADISKDPYISYVERVPYSSGNICGISSNEVSSINGVLITNISKVNNI